MASRVLTRLTVALLLVNGASVSAQPLPSDSLQTARKYAQWFLAGQVDSLLAHITGSAEALGGRAGILKAGADVADRAGTEVRLVEERWVWRGGRRQYWRTMAMSNIESNILLRIVIRDDGAFAGFGTGLASNPPPVDSGGPPIRP